MVQMCGVRGDEGDGNGRGGKAAALTRGSRDEEVQGRPTRGGSLGAGAGREG